MERTLIVLQLMLKELGIPRSIDDINARLLIQKGVYLGQRAGASLNYGYGWYLKGPYSTDLTKDYYKLQELIESEPGSIDGYTLRDDISAALHSIKPILTPPAGVPLGQPQWVELLASLDFARTTLKKSDDAAKSFVASEKPYLAAFVDKGFEVLQSSILCQ